MTDTAFRLPPELDDVSSQVGDFIQYWGFKKIHGRIWAHLFLAATPLDARDLIMRLGVSKALVSMSISELVEHEVIQISGKSTRGTITYRANPDVTTVISNVLRKREKRMLSRITSAVRLLKDLPENSRGSTPLSNARIETLSTMVETAEENLDGLLQLADISLSDWSAFDRIDDPADDPADDPDSGKKPR